MSKILVITDNDYLFDSFKIIIDKLKLADKYKFTFRFSPQNKLFLTKYINNNEFEPINLKDKSSIDFIINEFNLVLSLHCKQIFPIKMVNAIRCVNIHPGLNPFNRGWFPQVFSILNGLPAGVTIHEIDDKLDNGPVIYQQEIKIESNDTSESVYNRILDIEINMLEKYIVNILEQDYVISYPSAEGNLNYLMDFKKLCEIDLKKQTTFEEAINLLRALTHGKHKNAYFVNNIGQKVFVSINLEVEGV